MKTLTKAVKKRLCQKIRKAKREEIATPAGYNKIKKDLPAKFKPVVTKINSQERMHGRDFAKMEKAICK